MDPLWSAFEAGRCLNIAHRGARSLAPENTLAAAEAGRLAGADAWELDVGLSRDGALVVVHDATLERTSDARTRFPDRAPWRVEDFSLAELKALDFGSWFLAADPFGQVAAGQATHPQAFQGLTIPTLAEALEFTRAKGWLVNVELKHLDSDPRGLAFPARAVRLIQDLDMVERVLVSSFNHGYLVQVRRVEPRLDCGALVHRLVADPVALVKNLGLQAFHPAWQLVSAASLQLLREAGVPTLIWTINDELKLGYFRKIGAAGLITDFPQVLAGLKPKDLADYGAAPGPAGAGDNGPPP